MLCSVGRWANCHDRGEGGGGGRGKGGGTVAEFLPFTLDNRMMQKCLSALFTAYLWGAPPAQFHISPSLPDIYSSMYILYLCKFTAVTGLFFC
jgi:hypothetical protein